MQIPRRTYLSAAMGAMLVSSAVHAGGFSLYTEGSGAAIGNYAAGIAASVQDASTGWYNPAGLPFLGKEQAVLSGVGVLPTNKLTGTSTFSTIGLAPYVQNFSGLESGVDAFVPAFHYALPLSDRVAIGVSIVSPFGLSTKYESDAPVRYAATFTELLTANLSPEIGAKITENFSVGGGLDWQWSQVKFNRVLGSPTLLQFGGLPPNRLDSLSYNKGHSVGIGFHVGALASFNDNHSRIGLNYQSRMRHTFRGYSELTGRLADPLLTNPNAVFRSDGLFSNATYFPDILTVSGYHDVNDKLAVMGSVIYTNWGLFKETTLNNVAVGSPTVGQIVTNSTNPQNYRDAWRLALGANYQVNEQVMVKGGVGFDQTPTIDAERDVRLSDANRYALSVGGHYQYNPAFGVDLGYTYLFANKQTPINKISPLGTTSAYTVTAHSKPHAHLIGAQLVWTIDQEVTKTK